MEVLRVLEARWEACTKVKDEGWSRGPWGGGGGGVNADMGCRIII